MNKEEKMSFFLIFLFYFCNFVSFFEKYSQSDKRQAHHTKVGELVLLKRSLAVLGYQHFGLYDYFNVHDRDVYIGVWPCEIGW